MPVELVAQLVTTLPLAGLIWLVQLVVYPQFGRVGAVEFAAYHAAHSRGITYVVGPLMLGELVAASAWFLREVTLLAFVGLAFVVIAWGVTALSSVPQHHVLSRGFEAPAHRRLVVTNWLRTLAWTARGIIVIAAVLGFG